MIIESPLLSSNTSGYPGISMIIKGFPWIVSNPGTENAEYRKAARESKNILKLILLNLSLLIVIT
jgi:hypothetical protein